MSEQQEQVTLNTDTLMGDLRDAILDRLRAMPKPWTVMSETEQRDMIEGVERVSRHLVVSAVKLIAANGHSTIPTIVDQAVMKDGLKVVLRASKIDPLRHDLIDAVGKSALIVIADPEPFMGETGPATPDPDQPSIAGIGDNVSPIGGARRKKDG